MSPVRTAEVHFLGDAGSVMRAAQAAAAATAEAEGKISASSSKAAAAQEAAATRTAKAHEKMVASAAKSNESFAKWGTAAGVGVIAAAADMAIKVESAATAIAKAGGTGTDAGKKIEDAFRTIPGTVEYSARKIGEAFATVAGELKVVEGHALTAGEAMRVMKAALDLADASGNSLTESTEALGKVMMTFHLHTSQAAEAADVLFNASKVTGIGVNEFTTLVDKARGRLGALAPSLQETAGLMAELAKQGVAGRLTMGALGGAFGTLLSQSKSVTATLKELNVHVFDNRGRFVGLKSVIEQLHPVLARYDQASQLQITRTLFGEKANKQLLEVIHQGVPAFETSTRAVSRHGAAADAAAKEHQTLQGKLKATRADAENLAATLGERLIPVFQKVVGAISDSIKWFDKHRTAAKALEVVIATVLGAAMLDFAVVKVAKVVGGIKTMIAALASLMAKMTATAAVVTAEDGAIVAANEAAGASFVAFAATAVKQLAIVGAAIAGAVLAVKGLEGLLGKITGESQKVNELLGGNQPGESGAEGQHAFSGRTGAAGRLSGDTGGGILAYFMSKGLTEAQAAGIVGNLQQESGLNPRAAGGGIYQGLGSRQPRSGTVAGQIEQIWQELTSTPEYGLSALRHARSPQEAARIFSEHFEKPGTPMLSNRERYAQEALRAHPHGGGSGRSGGSYVPPSTSYGSERLSPAGSGGSTGGTGTHRMVAAIERYSNPFAGASNVTRSRTDQGVDFSFSGSLGAVGKGRIVNIVQDPGGFGTEIVEELTEGPHKGQFVYYGLETGASSLTHKGQSVRSGQALARGKGSGGIELGFASGPGGVPVTPYGPGQSHGVPTAGGQAFSSFLASIGKGGSNLQLATAQFSEVAKRAAAAIAHLILSPAQERKVSGLLGQAGEAHATAQMYGGYATEAASAWEHARGLQQKKVKPLYTAEGAQGQTLIDEQDIQTAKARKLYYQREVAALGREAKAWGKLRDQYRSFARHAKGNAKKEALNKAAGYDGKVKAAQKEAQALNGTIGDVEAQIEEAQQVLSGQLPGEIAAATAEHQAGDLAAYQAANAKIDLEERAGLLTPEQAKAAKEANANRALGGGYGELSGEGRLQVMGDLREFAKATQEATSALEAHTSALKESQKALNDFLHASEKLAGLENSTVLKAMADLISGQIGGVSYHGRSITAGAGSAARY